jgi:hypothetical protein
MGSQQADPGALELIQRPGPWLFRRDQQFQRRAERLLRSAM